MLCEVLKMWYHLREFKTPVERHFIFTGEMPTSYIAVLDLVSRDNKLPLNISGTNKNMVFQNAKVLFPTHLSECIIFRVNVACFLSSLRYKKSSPKISPQSQVCEPQQGKPKSQKSEIINGTFSPKAEVHLGLTAPWVERLSVEMKATFKIF